MSVTTIVLIVLGALTVLILLLGIRIVRPTEVGLIETLGRFKGEAKAGFHWILPIIQSMIYVDITETMADTRPHLIITKDNLNARVDAIVYYRITNPKDSQYNIDNCEVQLVALTQTTLRAVIGGLSFTAANENRKDINDKVEAILDKETSNYGVDVLRVEIQRIEAPDDVQEAMNEVVKAERIKIAAKDKANALEIQAEGVKRAEIQKAEGVKESQILIAHGEAEAIKVRAVADAEAIKVVNKAADESFTGNAVQLKQLETYRDAFEGNTKYVVSSDVAGMMSGILEKITKG